MSRDMFDGKPDYVILSGGGSIADLSGQPELLACADCVVEKFLDRLMDKEKESIDGQENGEQG